MWWSPLSRCACWRGAPCQSLYTNSCTRCTKPLREKQRGGTKPAREMEGLVREKHRGGAKRAHYKYSNRCARSLQPPRSRLLLFFFLSTHHTHTHVPILLPLTIHAPPLGCRLAAEVRQGSAEYTRAPMARSMWRFAPMAYGSLSACTGRWS
jgi:hypothetical protein